MKKPAPLQCVEPDLKRAVALVIKMMSIPGPTGAEGRIIRFITEQLRRAGMPARGIFTDAAHRHSRIGGQAGNLIVRLPGTMRGPRHLLMAHVDTVPICVGSRPVRRGGLVRSVDRTTGLGADNRSGAAVLLTAALEILRRKLRHQPVTFVFPVQEEIGLVGVRHMPLSKLGRPTLAFNFDGGSPSQIIIGATGAYRTVIEIKGVASHAGVHPEDGVSAIAIAGLAISKIHNDGWHGDVHKGRRRGTSNIGLIEGGSASNVVAPSATVRAEARSHDQTFRKRILGAIVKAFEHAARSVRNQAGQCGTVRVESELDYESFRLAPGQPCVVAAENAIRSIGAKPTHVIVDGGLDANIMTARGIPTVTLGAGQHHPHTVDELLHVKEFENGCRIALRLAMGLSESDQSLHSNCGVASAPALANRDRLCNQ